MQAPQALLEDSGRRLAHARELHAEASAARRRSKERQRQAEAARAIVQRLRHEPMQWIRNETALQMAERHVVEAERHVEHQKKLIELLVRDKHKRMLAHAHRVLEVLERSQRLAQTRLALARSAAWPARV